MIKTKNDLFEQFFDVFLLENIRKYAIIILYKLLSKIKKVMKKSGRKILQ